MPPDSRFIVFDSTIQELNEPVAPAVSRGLMYGEGCFETFRSYAGRFFLLEEHLGRLEEGLKYLGIGYPRDLSVKSCRRFVMALLDQNGLESEDAVVRIQVWRDGNRGYAVEQVGDSHFTIAVSSMPGTKQPVTLSTVSIPRIPSQAVPSAFKLTNGINYILATGEARDKGADDALMCTVDGIVSETPIANLFWKKGGTVYTPSKECDLLPGLTRGVLIGLIEDETNHALQTGRWGIEALFEADTAWTCNSVREIVPVASVDGRELDAGDPFLEILTEAFSTYRTNRLI